MNGKRYSRQRELIFETLKGTDRHPTAEMVYQWLKPENPALSLGTVYRNLNLLADEGAITRMAFPVERYDANTQPHPHFRCSCCGEVYDLPLPYDAELDLHAEENSGHKVDRHELIFSGVCCHCTTKQ
jgi:Fur family peroxide stress response transcriptional regulator